MPAWHEDNPYIKDELYFANVTQIGKKDFFYTIRRTNDFVAITLGSMLSCFLFYLITHRLPTHFKLYKKMLLLGWGIDTIVLINTFLIQSRVRSFNTYVLITFSGAVSWLGASTFCYVNVVQFSGSAVACAILPVQFYYRYFTLKTHYPLSNRHLILCLCFSIAFVLPLSLNVSYLYCADKYDPNPDKLDLSSYWFPEAPIPPVIVSQSRSFNNAVQRIYGGVVFFAYYLISVFLAWKTMQLLREKFSGILINKKVRRVQGQLTKTLFAQAAIPFTLTSIPRMMGAFTPFTNLANGYSGEISMIFQLWFPTLNLLATLLLIKPFRRYFIQLICCNEKRPMINAGSGTIVFTMQERVTSVV